MKRDLALYFGHDFVMAAIAPYPGKFQLLSKRGIRRFPLYFYLAPNQQDWDYGDEYRVNYLENDPQAIGNYYEQVGKKGTTFMLRGYEKDVVELLDKILDDFRAEYLRIFNELSDTELSATDLSQIPTRIAFSESVPKAVQQPLRDYLRKRGMVPAGKTKGFAQLLTESMVASGELLTRRRPGLIVDAVSDDLFISLIHLYGPEALERESLQQYRGFGADPRIRVIAKYVVDEANNVLHMLSTEADKEDEYARHLEKARKWRDALDRSIKPFLPVKTSLAVASTSTLPITIRKETVDEAARDHIRQIVRYLTHQVQLAGTTPDQVEKVVVIGDTLNNPAVLAEFQQTFGMGQVIHKSESGLSEVLKTMLEGEAELVAEPQAGKNNSNGSGQATKDLEVVLADQLSEGEMLEFGWEPLGKAPRKVRAVYNANHAFVVIKAENSKIIEGDQFRCEAFLLGKPLRLKNVVRNKLDRPLGDYLTKVPLSRLRRV